MRTIEYEERSFSKRMMDRVVRLTNPERWQLYMDVSIRIREIDNLIDEGDSFARAKRAIPNVYCAAELMFPIVKPEDKPYLIYQARQLTHAFEIDLDNRKLCRPYTEEELNIHNIGGWLPCFAVIKLLTKNQRLTNPNFLKLLQAHAEVEPLGDLETDLKKGTVLFVKEKAPWVNDLKVDGEVPYEEIDQHVKSRRFDLAKRILELSPYATLEFRNILGALCSLDYVRRAISLTRSKFAPSNKVVFAEQKLGE